MIKILPVGTEFYADERTDGHEEGNSRFSKFLNASKNNESTRSTLFAPVFINAFIYLFIYLIYWICSLYMTVLPVFQMQWRWTFD